MKISLGLAVAIVAVMPAAALAQDAGDPAKGEKVFRKCKACHLVDEEKNRVGPHLVGIVGRPAASVEGFKYSKALQEKAAEVENWEEDELFAYLENPPEFIGGRSKMAFKLRKEDERRDVIAYLKSVAPSQ